LLRRFARNDGRMRAERLEEPASDLIRGAKAQTDPAPYRLPDRPTAA
jgi:hypothetical protein